MLTLVVVAAPVSRLFGTIKPVCPFRHHVNRATFHRRALGQYARNTMVWAGETGTAGPWRQKHRMLP